MSRYPGTQFKVYDNSQATAIVPITNAGPADSVTYLSTFASVKGPEGITLSYGNNFYNRYGTQDKVDFKKYGQPLFQTSMNVNNGANILAKRAVLDDATLGNATIAVVLTKYRDVIIETDSVDKTRIKSINYNNNSDYKYSIAPLVFSVENANNYAFANVKLDEHKERYDLYKNYIIDIIANEDTPDNRFLSKLIDGGSKDILSGFTQSIFYDNEDRVINISSEGKNQVRQVVNITTGLTNGEKKTFSSTFDAKDDIINATAENNTPIGGTPVYDTTKVWQNLNGDNTADEAGYTIAKYVVYRTGEGTTESPYQYEGYWMVDNEDCNRDATVTPSAKIEYKDIATKIDIKRFFTSITELQDIVDAGTWNTEEAYAAQNPSEGTGHYEYAFIQGLVTTDRVPNPDYDSSVSGSEQYIYPINGIYRLAKGKDIINTAGYENTNRLINDMMTKRSGYIVCEWIFPMFSIFDIGRSESVKSIGIEYDASTSVTLKKAIYKLCVYNYDTSKKLEQFQFSLNPYERNNGSGYTFDIESTVNYNSEQISVKTYYESYDALLETLQLILQSTDNNLIGNYDILFGHAPNGKYNAFSSYQVSNLLKRNAYIYDYAHLDVFDNDIITVNAYCDWENMTSTDETLQVKGYYYNWIRTNKKILERLEFGSNGYNIDRIDEQVMFNNTVAPVVPVLVIDEKWENYPDSSDGSYGYSMAEIMELTGHKNGTIISSNTLDLNDSPIVPENFVAIKIPMIDCTKYEYDLEYTGGTGEIEHCKPTLSKIVPDKKAIQATRFFFASEADGVDGDAKKDAAKASAQNFAINNKSWAVYCDDIDLNTKTWTNTQVLIPYTIEKIYQKHYYRFFAGEFDKDIFNLDVYFPNAVFDANYDNDVKLAIQRLAAYRGDFMCYMDMGINRIKSYEDCAEVIPGTETGLDLTSETSSYAYVRDMHVAVTCLNYKIRNPYDNRIIHVTGTYGLSNLYITHYNKGVGDVFAGVANGVTINNIIEGTVNYVPKIYPTTEMTSLNNIGGVYPSDDATIINEKQLMCDLRVNYGCYYDDRFSIETEYTMNPTESEFSYWNNVSLVCLMMQAIRKACPAARYQFITADDLTVYKDAVETAIKPWRNRFASVKFKYVQDDAALENKIFYAAIEVVFRPFAQAEIFELTALNYSTLSSAVTSV